MNDKGAGVSTTRKGLSGQADFQQWIPHIKCDIGELFYLWRNPDDDPRVVDYFSPGKSVRWAENAKTSGSSLRIYIN